MIILLLQRSNQHVKSDINIQCESNVYYSHTLQFTRPFNNITTQLIFNSVNHRFSYIQGKRGDKD